MEEIIVIGDPFDKGNYLLNACGSQYLPLIGNGTALIKMVIIFAHWIFIPIGIIKGNQTGVITSALS